VTASTVGPDLAPTGAPAGAAEADRPREVVDRVPIGTPERAEEDPWTGQPYRETTPPGPSRPGAKPAVVSPAALTPTPTTGGDRGAQIAGGPPSSETATVPEEQTVREDPPTDRSVPNPEPTVSEPVPDPSSEPPTIVEPEPSVSTDPPPPPSSSVETSAVDPAENVETP
jgi:hypothetical protein